MLVLLPLLTGAILARAAAGKSVVWVDSGAGLLAVMDLDPGSSVITGDSATRSSRVGRTAANLANVDAVVRVFKTMLVIRSMRGLWCGMGLGPSSGLFFSLLIFFSANKKRIFYSYF